MRKTSMNKFLGRLLFWLSTSSFVGIFLFGCAASGDNPGLEYAPQMYHSTPYEPLTQIQDEEAGTWLSSTEAEPHGEFYNSNPYNPHKMTMRKPVANTIARNQFNVSNFDRLHIAPDDYATAESKLVSPLDSNQVVLGEGKVLYERFCEHCHGTKGQGDGSVGKVYKGVTSYTSAAVKDKGPGHIFHVITHGKGRMGAHASQISVEDRWKIVSYVQTLQNQ